MIFSSIFKGYEFSKGFIRLKTLSIINFFKLTFLKKIVNFLNYLNDLLIPSFQNEGKVLDINPLKLLE